MPTWVFAELDAAQPKFASIGALDEYLREHEVRFDLIGSPIGRPTCNLAEINRSIGPTTSTQCSIVPTRSR